MSNTGSTGPEFVEGKKCVDCKKSTVLKNGIDNNIQRYICSSCGCVWDANYAKVPLKERYEVVVEEYVTAFCQRNGFDRKDGHWVGDRPGEIFDIADMCFDFREIRFDMDTAQSPETIIKYYWERLNNEGAIPFPNYENWCSTNTEEEK
jgi:hypothetical protein